MAPLCYRRHRFPPEIIQHAIWLYVRFTLSYRDVEELLAERSRDRATAAPASPAAERPLAFGRDGRADHRRADVSLACRRPRGRGPRHARPAPTRHPSGVAANAQAAQEARICAEMLVTDKLRSYASAVRRLRLACPHEQGLGKNNRVENSHQAVRRRRAQAAAVQVASICPALPQHSRCGSQHLQPATPPHLPIDIADLPSRSYRAVARCRRNGMTRDASRLSVRAR